MLRLSAETVPLLSLLRLGSFCTESNQLMRLSSDQTSPHCMHCTECSSLDSFDSKKILSNLREIRLKMAASASKLRTQACSDKYYYDEKKMS